MLTAKPTRPSAVSAGGRQGDHMTKLIGRHLRNIAVGYIALTVALGGTSYAATNPMASGAQIQSPTVQPAS